MLFNSLFQIMATTCDNSGCAESTNSPSAEKQIVTVSPDYQINQKDTSLRFYSYTSGDSQLSGRAPMVTHDCLISLRVCEVSSNSLCISDILAKVSFLYNVIHRLFYEMLPWTRSTRSGGKYDTGRRLKYINLMLCIRSG